MREPVMMMLRRWKRWIALRVARRVRRVIEASMRKIVPWRRPLLRVKVEMAKNRPERIVHAADASDDC